MAKRTIIDMRVFFIMLLSLIVSGAAFAQRCDVEYELIFKFKPAQIGSYNVWDIVDGEEDLHERFVSGISEGRLTIVAGEQRADMDAMPKLSISAIDGRGRKIWHKTHDVSGLHSIVKMLKTRSGYVIVGHKKSKADLLSMWFGFVDSDGNLKGQKTIQGEGSQVQVHDIISSRDGKFYLVAASLHPSGGSPYSGYLPGYSAIYRVSLQGEKISRSALLPGIENRIFSLTTSGDNGYVAGGFVRGDDGRDVGWVVGLSDAGGIRWQRQYPRGKSARLTEVTDYINGHFVAAGETEPHDTLGENKAGWLMTVNADNGQVAWQRYYAGEVDYEASGLHVNRDQLISFMLEALPTPRVQKDFVRVLTVNQRGTILRSDEYFNAEGARAFQMIEGPSQERILIGETDMKYTIEGYENVETMIKRSKDGWVIAGEPPDIYNDPCKGTKR